MTLPSDNRDPLHSNHSTASSAHSFRTANEDAKPMSIIPDQSSESAGSTVVAPIGLSEEKPRTSSATGASNFASGEDAGYWKDHLSKEGDPSEEEDDWTFPEGGIEAWSVVFVSPAYRHYSYGGKKLELEELNPTFSVQGCFMLAGAGMGYSLIWGSWLQVKCNSRAVYWGDVKKFGTPV